MGKIVFLDVDGTLVDYQNRLPESAVKAVRQARANGHRVYICTGRSKAEMQPQLWDIGLDGMIGGNGSYVEDHGEVLLHRTLTVSQCTRVVEWLHGRGLEFYLESNNGLFASEHLEEAGRPAFLQYARMKGDEVAAETMIRELFSGMTFGTDLHRDDVNKISFVLSDYQDHLDSVKEFPDLQARTWGGKGEEALFGDLGIREMDKGTAVSVLLGYLHADITDTVAFGDASVDIPMIQICGTGVAMGNGGPEIRAAADYVTDDVEADGLWNAFGYLGLI